VQQGQPSEHGTLHDLDAIASAMKGWATRERSGDLGDAAETRAADQESGPTETATEEPVEQHAEAKPEASEEVAEEVAAQEEEPEDVEATVELEIDGKAERFTREELRAGVLRQRDYTRKTQELAEGRRIVEAQAEQVGTRLRTLSERIAQLDTQLKGEDTSAYDQLRQTDPAEWSARMLERRQRFEALARGHAEYQRTLSQQREEMQRREAEILREKIPAWKDPAVAGREYGELITFAVQEYGLTQDVLENVASDHRFVLLARDARQHREATRKADVLKQKMRKLPRVQQPGAAGQRESTGDVEYRQSLERLRTTGGRNMDDIAAAFKARFRGR